MNSPFWQRQVYLYVVSGCGLFILLTVAAMFAYPGGLFTGELTSGYDFFRNLFSDLGRTMLAGGKSNTVRTLKESWKTAKIKRRLKKWSRRLI